MTRNKDMNEKIESNVKNMTEKEDYLKIFQFLHENDIKYSENDNGTFINLNSLNKKTLNKFYELTEEILGSKKIEKNKKR